MKWWDRFLVFWVLSLKPTFSCSSFTFIKRLFSSSLVVQGDPTKGNQSWIFIGRTNVEAKTPILWPPDMKNWLTGKDPDAGKYWRREEKRVTEDEMVGWHHWLNGHEFEQAPGTGDGPGSLACCSPWGHRVRHDWATELNWIECFLKVLLFCHLYLDVMPTCNWFVYCGR